VSYRSNIASIGLGLLLMACSPSSPASSDLGQAPTSPSATPSPAATLAATVETNPGQTLPISAEAKVANQTIQLEVAQTPEQQAIGLMFRPPLPDDRGMLFPFQPARVVSFWMKNVSVPLDMVFLRNGKVEAIALNVPPCETEPCPTYGPNISVDAVIEMRAGRAAELGLKVGDRITIQPIKPSAIPHP